MGHEPLKVIYIFSFSFSTLRLTQVGDISGCQGSDTEQGVGGRGMECYRMAFVGINKWNSSFITYFSCGRMATFGLFTVHCSVHIL